MFSYLSKVTSISFQKLISHYYPSDGVLNPSGVRFGSAEIYAVTDTFPEIEDTICVGQRRPTDDDEAVLLFVKMKSKHRLSHDLVGRLKAAIRERYSARHIPAHIFEVADIPYTINGKKCEINVRQIVSGMKSAVSGTVANPESLQLYQQYVHLPRNGSIAKDSGRKQAKL
jgi:acetoacetyl-CoA synthetase